MTERPVFTLERQFRAPRNLVWKTWTQADLFARWYGPNVDTILHTFDIQPGGSILLEMRWDGGSKHERIEITELDAPHQIRWLQSAVDENWHIAPMPQMPDWPRVLDTKITLIDTEDGTHLTLTWTPHNATQAELDCFRMALAGLDKGWGAGMEVLAELLRSLQAETA